MGQVVERLTILRTPGAQEKRVNHPQGAVQLLRNAPRGGASVTLCDRGGGGLAERYVTPKIIYMYNIIL